MFINRLKAKILQETNNEIVALADGKLISLDKVKDEVFSKRIMGDGIAIELTGNMIVAPASGTIKMLFPTMHAFGLVLDNGIEILVHVGLDTVELKGKGFKRFVNVNAKVRKGDPIIQIDKEFIEREGYDTTALMIFTSCNDYQITHFQEGMVKKGKSVVATFTKSNGT
jgi:glucose-specific phosphotransferase system IIA component